MITRLCISIAAATVTTAVYAEDIIRGPVDFDVVRIIDGDTLDGWAKIWPQHRVLARIRIAGVDTPELFSPKCSREQKHAEAARKYLARLVPLRSIVQLTNVRIGAHAKRHIAKVTVNGKNVAQELIDADLGRKYDGGRRRGWCGT